jgi:hypothetical protein
MVRNLPLNLVNHIQKNSLEKELYLFLYLTTQGTKVGWHSIDKVKSLSHGLFNTKRTQEKHLKSLIKLGWVTQSKGNYHFKSIAKITRELGLIRYYAQSVVLDCAKHLPNLETFKAFMLHAVVAGELRQNYRRRHDKRYRVNSRRDNTLERIDPTRLSKTVGNQHGKITLTTGEYSYRLIREAIGFSLTKTSKLFKLLRTSGEMEQYQQYCPKFDAMKFTERDQVVNWIKYVMENDTYNYHFRRIKKYGDYFRMKDLYLSTVTLTVTKKKYS